MFTVAWQTCMTENSYNEALAFCIKNTFIKSKLSVSLCL